MIFDVRTGGEATPDPFLGTVGTPVRGTYVPEPTTAPGLVPTPTPQVTVPSGTSGTPDERDEQRRNDLLQLLGTANEYRSRNGSYPDSGGNVQTLCSYREYDQACALEEIVGGELLVDPFGDPIANGYWYASDGDSVTLYAALEGEIPDDQRCATENVDLQKKPNLICITGP